MITDALRVPPISVGGGNSRERLGGVSQNYTDFLKLLTTQLQNQDPTSPTDTNQVTQQIATLSQVEQQLKTNTNLEKLVSLYQATQYNNLTNYIGRKIEAEGNVGELRNGNASFNYNLVTTAVSVEIKILDNNGNTVRTITNAPRSAGTNQYLWDGKDNQGNIASEGLYTMTVTAKNNSGESIIATGSQAQMKHTKPEFVYYLGTDASKVNITIKDENGGVIRRDITSGTRIAGRNPYVWDGKDNNGNSMPEGTYKIEVEALDEQNRLINSRTFMTGVVTSIDSVNGSAFLSINGGDIAIPLERITSIRLAT